MLNNWLENYVKPSHKSGTYKCYAKICTLHIIPKLGCLDLNNVSAVNLQKAITELLSNGNLKTGKGLSTNSVNVVISVIQNSLKTAFAIELTNDYCANKIKRPKIIAKQIDCFSLQEQKKI